MVRSDPFFSYSTTHCSEIPYTAVYGPFRSFLQLLHNLVLRNPIHGSVWFVQILSSSTAQIVSTHLPMTNSRTILRACSSHLLRASRGPINSITISAFAHTSEHKS